ncbi:MAG TPA: 3-deoxy-8-phosphooctulonate synthase [Chlamydiales bacterium]|nr:3-deoxy-8-phosphooctulonate synthase [Chlamydiales bacterium]
MEQVPIKNFLVGEGQPLTVICGPCVMEGEDFTFRAAEELKELFRPLPFSFIFKASYDKANRSSLHSFRGVGIDRGMAILQKIQREFDLPVTTDVHTVEEAKIAGAVCDVLQLPAFLCRQTDLLVAAGETGAAVNVKKGQFLAPWDMKNVVEKLLGCGNRRIILTDRGTSFGYNNLVSDMRAIPIMQKFGFPVCFDASHSVQLPGGLGHATGGQREFIPTLAKAAVAAGCNALFIEAHPNPAQAKSDAASVMPYDALKTLLYQIAKLYDALQEKSCLRDPRSVSLR